MNSRTKKVLSSILLTVTMVQLFWLLPAGKANAVIDLKTASAGILNAGIGCGVNKLLQNQLAKKIENKLGMIDAVQTGDSQTQASTAALELKQTCLDKIARAAAQTVLKEITAQTVDYINHGFKGEPLFVRNPQSFFKSIADREIGGFANLFQDQRKYPFGKSFIQGYIGSVKRTFAQNAEYSLYKALAPGITPQDYYRDFSRGGWDAWFATTQLPQNNPYGFSIMASNELGARLQGTTQSEAQNIRNELQQGLGFLSPKRCVDANFTPWPATERTEAVVRAEMQAAEDAVPPDPNYPGGNPDAIAAADKPFLDEIVSHTCQREEVTTPGGIIANQLTTTLGSPLRQLELSNDLDSSLQAIFDALLNQLFTKGLASLSGNTNSSSTQIYSNGGSGNNSSIEQTSNNTNNQNDQWFNQHPDFDITDLSGFQKIINTQQDFINAIIDNPAVAAPVLNSQAMYPNITTLYPSQDRAIPSKGQNYWIGKLIPEIYQLDYCIPGPHPGWENDARTKLNAFESTMKDVSSLKGEQLFQIYNSLALGTPQLIANLWSNLFFHESTDEIIRQKLYAVAISNFTGIIAERDDNIGTREKTIAILDSIFDKFANQVNNVRFSPIVLPAVTGEAYNEFRKIDGYNSLVQDNNSEVTIKQGSIRRLGNIKDQITILKNNLSTGAITQNDFDQSIAVLKKSFATIAPSLAVDDDVTAVKNQTEQVIDEIAYIHNTLLKDPVVGCEADVANVPAFSRVRAFPYPGPHLYDYPVDGTGDGSIDLGSLGINPVLDNLSVIAPYTSSTYFPFMEYAFFGTPQATHPGPAGWDEIHITDLMNFDIGEVSRTVGIFEARIGPLW